MGQSSAFDNSHEDLCKSLMAGIETPESFCQKLAAALAQEKK